MQEYVRFIRRQWLIVSGSVFAAFAVGLTVTLVSTPMYGTRLAVFITATTSEGDRTNAAQAADFAASRMPSYVDLLTSQAMAVKVSRALPFRMPSREVQSALHVTVPEDTVLLRVNVAASTRVKAMAIARTVSTQFPRMVATLERPVVGDPPLQAVIAEQPSAIAAKVAPSPRRYIILSLLVGTVAGFTLALIREGLNRRIRDRYDVLAALERPPLGVWDGFDIGLSRLLLLQRQHGSPRLISVVSSSGSESDSHATVALQLANGCTALGERVLVLDGDLRYAGLTSLCDLRGDPGVTDLFRGTAAPADFTRMDGSPILMGVGTRFTESATTGDTDSAARLRAYDSKRVQAILTSLEGRFDIVIVDVGAFLDSEVGMFAVGLTAGAILCVPAGRATKDLVRASEDLLRALQTDLVGVIVTKDATEAPYGSARHRKNPQKTSLTNTRGATE